MLILVACEESQRVCVAFRNKGHEAYSCDIINTSGSHPEWHIKTDVTHLLDGYCEFTTCDGTKHKIPARWDMIIAFPPCTYLTSACNRAYSLRCNTPDKIANRIKNRDSAYMFFTRIYTANCDKIAIENPVGYMNSHFKKPTQIIQPYQFGEPYTKRTCLWLQGLPALTPTNILPHPDPIYICQGEKSRGKKIYWSEAMRGVPDRAKERSKTFLGIANAMADQWG